MVLESDVKIADCLAPMTLQGYDEEKSERKIPMSQYAEPTFEEEFNHEALLDQSPSLTAEASATAILIAKRQAILDYVEQEKAAGQRVKFDWRELLEEAEVTLDEARQKLATYVLQTDNREIQRLEATRASLFLEWFAADGKSVTEVTLRTPAERPAMYQAVRELTPALIDPFSEPDYRIDPAIIDQLSARSSAARPKSSQAVSSRLKYNQPSVRNTVKQPTITDNDPDSLDWQLDALCAQMDPEIFFPDRGGSSREGKQVCSSCGVRDQCLDYAIKNDEKFGIWGGKSERELRQLKQRRRRPII